MKHVLAIDQGTTGTTCLMLTGDGRMAGRGYREHTQHYPRAGWVEHDPAEVMMRVLEAAREAIDAANAAPDAIGITNQRETVVAWERASGAPVGRAIVWQDRRTTQQCAELASLSPRIGALTGLVVDPYFSATKIAWMLDTGGLRERAEAGEVVFGTVDSWIVWRLTGGDVFATEPTNASRTMIFDIGRMSWSEELCALFGVPTHALPEVRSSAGVFGMARGSLLGLSRDVPIGGIAGDQQAALYGQGCWEPGEGKNTYGTGAFLLLNTGTERVQPGGGLLTTVGCDADGGPVYVLEAAIFVAGAAVQWLRDGLGIIASAAETEAMARSVETTDGVYFVPALVGLGAPHWEPDARGTIVGITRGTGRAQLARAALEAMAYSTADVLSLMRARSSARFDRLRVDGGATANDWLMQFQADVLGVPVERPDMVETTALGAAALAGIATGVWRNASEFLSTREFDRFEPGAGREAAQDGARHWQRAVRAALGWARDPA